MNRILNDMDKYLKIARELLLSNLDRQKFAIFLFGRRAFGPTGRASDIDVGILGDETLDPLTRDRLEELLDESIVPYHIDLVDFKQVSKEFRQHALRKIEIWNKPKHIDLNLTA
jgi:predicted nucleotidyltransferase